MIANNAFRMYSLIGSVIIFGIAIGLLVHNYDSIVDYIYELIANRNVKH